MLSPETAAPSSNAVAATAGASSSSSAGALLGSLEPLRRRLWRLPLAALGFNLHEASELAAVLKESNPDLCIDDDPFGGGHLPRLRSTLSAR